MTAFDPDRRFLLSVKALTFGGYEEEDSFSPTRVDVRIKNCLRNDNVETIGHLVMRRDDELLKVPSFGRLCLKAVKERLQTFGLDTNVSCNHKIWDWINEETEAHPLGDDERAHWLKPESWAALSDKSFPKERPRLPSKNAQGNPSPCDCLR